MEDIYKVRGEQMRSAITEHQENIKKFVQDKYMEKAGFVPPITVVDRTEKQERTFEGGSKRDDDTDKPLVNHFDAYCRLRFGYLLRAGANKYDKGNWRKGQPIETALESLHRHIAKWEYNYENNIPQDEDHIMQSIFNLQLIAKNEQKAGIAVDHFYGKLK